jgi:hypothetical protein
MNTIQLIEVGIVEIYSYFEGKKFIIERLFKGSVINYRNLFLDDEPMQVYAECLNLCYILEVEEYNLVKIVNPIRYHGEALQTKEPHYGNFPPYDQDEKCSYAPRY